MLLPVILSGGAGTRLWPVSRKAYPKPFMKLADGRSLLEQTYERARRLADAPILTVTGRDYYFITRDEYAKDSSFSDEEHRFLLEPEGRNTAPAIALAAHYARRLHPDATLLVLPADHLIREEDEFVNAARIAEKAARGGALATFGIIPTHPETGYGYIEKGEPSGDGAFELRRFIEKPELEIAQRFLEEGNFAWNSGMFCFRAEAFLDALANYQPELAERATRCAQQSDFSKQPVELDAESFRQLPDISIDYAVMEKTDNAVVVPARFRWSDIGSWKAMSELEEADDAGNRVQGRAIMIDSRDCYLQGGQRLIATVGVQNLVVVDTGDAILVADRDRAQDVKSVVQQLRDSGDDAATYHQTVYRPWGSYTILEDADDCKVKRLVVKPGQVLSLQLHHRRSEHWTMVQGTAKVTVGDNTFLLGQNESTYIPIETRHRLENPTDEDIALIEVQCGDYFGEDDIVRFEDVYGRT